MDEKLALGQAIKAARKRLGLTQTEFASRLGVSKQCVGGWEQGRTAPDVFMLSTIAKFTQIDLSFLLLTRPNSPSESRAESNLSLSTTERILIQKLRSLSCAKRQAVETLFGIHNVK